MHTTATARLRRVVTRPFPGVGRPVAFLATGVLIQFGVLFVLALPWMLFVPAAMWAVLLAVLVPSAAVVLAGPLLTGAQHGRFLNRLGVAIPSPDAGRRPGPLMWLRTPAGRQQLNYHLLKGPLLSLAATLVLLTWAVAGAAVSVYGWIWLVPLDWRVDHPGYTTWAAYVTAAGLAGLYTAAWLSGALSRLDVRVATVLLGPSREERLARRIDDLTESRAGLVDAVDAERRRIERDLHDGAQQRLVSLAVTLGLARATLDDLPEDARRVLDEAHREAKEAIEELSGLVRGLHPAVLEDRGLDAAISGVAARAPLPVRVRADLPSRPSPTIEAVAYFVVSEALTNVVKHAEASRAEVTVERFGPTLLVVVSDDGVGGADPAAGTGLAGLAKRVAAVDGTLTVDSPVGGPTVMTVELPCVP
ncbi:sensor histidine kinase [Streptomyces sp. SID10815]|uniref:sensor histidine kinase n=1 Tax=Streptomyces sp. SID10815 TaxID=2706027 RepID=UPI0013CA85D4|nr:sensor histidine kinase [Streptomyces sp. SID10815]NEA48345.1 sensor histidine kinase [Streptomyces sp. SID10815]